MPRQLFVLVDRVVLPQDMTDIQRLGQKEGVIVSVFKGVKQEVAGRVLRMVSSDSHGILPFHADSPYLGYFCQKVGFEAISSLECNMAGMPKLIQFPKLQR